MRQSKLNVVYRKNNADYLITLLDNDDVAFFNDKTREVFEPFDVTGFDLVELKMVMADLNYIANKINIYKTASCSTYMFAIAKDNNGRNIFPLLEDSIELDKTQYNESANFPVSAITIIDCEYLNDAWHKQMCNANNRPVISAKTLSFEWIDTRSKKTHANAEILLESVKLSDPEYLREIIEDVESGIDSGNDGFAVFIDGICKYSTLDEYKVEFGHTAQLSVVIRDDVEHDLIYTLPILNGCYRYDGAVINTFRPIRFKPAHVNKETNFDQQAVESMINSLNELSRNFYRHDYQINRAVTIFAVDDDYESIFPFSNENDINHQDMIHSFADNHCDLYEVWLSLSPQKQIQSRKLRTNFVNAPVIKREQGNKFNSTYPLVSKDNPTGTVIEAIMMDFKVKLSPKVAIFLDGQCVASNHSSYVVSKRGVDVAVFENLLNLPQLTGIGF